MSDRWQSLIRKLWEPDGESLSALLLEIVDTIKATRNRAEAEKGLFTIFLSRAVQDLSTTTRLLTPAEVQPGYQASKTMADAAGLPLGKVRTDAVAAVNALNEYVALEPSEIVGILELQRKRLGLEKADAGSAQAQSTKRARRKLGISRSPGRPKERDIAEQ
jgi:hypothetical protein